MWIGLAIPVDQNGCSVVYVTLSLRACDGGGEEVGHMELSQTLIVYGGSFSIIIRKQKP